MQVEQNILKFCWSEYLCLWYSLSALFFRLPVLIYINTHTYTHRPLYMHRPKKAFVVAVVVLFSPVSATNTKECMFDGNCNQGTDKLFVITIVQDGYVYVLFKVNYRENAIMFEAVF